MKRKRRRRKKKKQNCLMKDVIIIRYQLTHRREEMKGLSWKQRRSVTKQRGGGEGCRQCGRGVGGTVSDGLDVSGCGCIGTEAGADLSTASIPCAHQPPALQMMTLGGPAAPAYPRAKELLVDLSPPPGDSTDPQTRDEARRDWCAERCEKASMSLL